MDKTDLALCLLLLQNSRTPVRELAGRLGLSVAAVHARVQALRDAGIIRAFTARIGLARLQATIAFVWGTSRAASSEDILERLTFGNWSNPADFNAFIEHVASLRSAFKEKVAAARDYVVSVIEQLDGSPLTQN